MARIAEFLRAPFVGARGVSATLLALYLAVNGLVAFNAVAHWSLIGYDSKNHLKYARVLGRDFRLPTSEETKEFFSPPAPYAIPAIPAALGEPMEVSGNAGQLSNVFWSLGLTFFLLAICEQWRPRNATLKGVSLLLLGMLPVYYKSFAFVRGEPLVAFATVLAMFLATRLFTSGRRRWQLAIGLGVALGLGVLSRQWAFFLFPAVAAVALVRSLRRPDEARSTLSAVAVSFAVAFLVGAWFYLHLYATYGRFTAFNRDPAASFSLANQPAEFWFGTGLPEIFQSPIRPAFKNQLVPIFYSEIWGDYHCYFLVYVWNADAEKYLQGRPCTRGERLRRELGDAFETNRERIGAYLGRVNLVSLLPTAVLLAGLAYGLRRSLRFPADGEEDSRATGTALLAWASVASALGYLWFLVQYPMPEKGDTIKATFLLHVFPLVAVLTGDLLVELRARSQVAFRALLAALLFCTVHNLPAMVTRFPVWR